MTRQEIEAAFLLSGIRLYAATPKENTYPGSQTIHRPIWDCMTDLGLITVGWRKRVISINWNAIGRLREQLPDQPGTGYDRWITRDDTDQGPNYVHAYGLPNVPRYLTELRFAVKDNRMELAS